MQTQLLKRWMEQYPTKRTRLFRITKSAFKFVYLLRSRTGKQTFAFLVPKKESAHKAWIRPRTVINLLRCTVDTCAQPVNTMGVQILFAGPLRNGNFVTELNFPWCANQNTKFALLNLQVRGIEYTELASHNKLTYLDKLQLTIGLSSTMVLMIFEAAGHRLLSGHE